ncbi:hypothetical protein STANM309S_04324 [Streptomyces tanashiensis]
MAELARPGPVPAQRRAAEDEAGAEPRTEVDVGEGAGGGGAQGESEGGGVGVLVEDDGQAQARGQLVPYGVAGPSGKPVTRPGTPARWSRGPGMATPTPSTRPPAGTGRLPPGATAPLPPVGAVPSSARTSSVTASRTGPAPVPRSTGRRRTSRTVPARSVTRAVSSSRSRWTPTAYAAEGSRRRTVWGLPPVEARWPASAVRPSARSRAVILLTACGVSPVRWPAPGG